MLDKVVEVPGVGNVAFPDSMSDERISAQIAKSLPTYSAAATAKAPHSFLGFLKNVAGSTTNAVGDAGGATAHPIRTLLCHRRGPGGPVKIREDYGAMSTAQIEAQKALLDLQPVLENAVNKATNRSRGGLKDLVTGAAGAMVSGGPAGGRLPAYSHHAG